MMQCVIHNNYSSALYMGAPSKETQTLDREKDALFRGRLWQLIVLDGKSSYVNVI